MARIVRGSGNDALATIAEVFANVMLARQERAQREKERKEDFEFTREENQKARDAALQELQSDRLTKKLDELSTQSPEKQRAFTAVARRKPDVFKKFYGVTIDDWEKMLTPESLPVEQEGLGEVDIQAPPDTAGLVRAGETEEQQELWFANIQNTNKEIRGFKNKTNQIAHLEKLLANPYVEREYGPEGVQFYQDILQESKAADAAALARGGIGPRPFGPGAEADERTLLAAAQRAEHDNVIAYRNDEFAIDQFVARSGDPSNELALYGPDGNILSPKDRRRYRQGKMSAEEVSKIVENTPQEARAHHLLRLDVNQEHFGTLEDAVNFVLETAVIDPAEHQKLVNERTEFYVRNILPQRLWMLELQKGRLQAQTDKLLQDGYKADPQARLLANDYLGARRKFVEQFGSAFTVTGKIHKLRKSRGTERDSLIPHVGREYWDFESNAVWSERQVSGGSERRGQSVEGFESGAMPILATEWAMMIDGTSTPAMKAFDAYAPEGDTLVPATLSEYASMEHVVKTVDAVMQARGFAPGSVTGITVPSKGVRADGTIVTISDRAAKPIFKNIQSVYESILSVRQRQAQLYRHYHMTQGLEEADADKFPTGTEGQINLSDFATGSSGDILQRGLTNELQNLIQQQEQLGEEIRSMEAGPTTTEEEETP